MAIDEKLTFHWADYTIFILSIVLSGSVGVVKGILDHLRRKKAMMTSEEGGDNGQLGSIRKVERNISVWPASLSVMASILAAPLILGVPTEIYLFGAQFAYFVLGIMVAIPFFAHYFLSRFYKLEISSIYEYLEYRFSKPVRSLCSAIFALSLVVYIGIITYAPAIVLSEMTDISTQLAVLGVGLIGIVYTAVGGLKGVIWVDAIQMLIILSSLLGLIIKGSIDVGGLGRVIDINNQGMRLERPSFKLSPCERHTVWTQMIGGGMSVLALFNNQAIVQKFLGLPSLRYVYITAYVSMAASCLYFLMFIVIGFVIYAYFHTCSPFLSGAVPMANKDNLVPFFVLSVFKDYPGMAGLFTTSVFCASLSTMAGGMNALAAVTVLDVVNPIYKKRNNNVPMTSKLSFIVFKVLVIVYGVLSIGMAFIASTMGKVLFLLAINLLGVVGAPILAVFLMGIFMPCINSVGAATGLVVSLLTMIILFFVGGITSKKYSILEKNQLQLSNETCTVAGNYSFATTTPLDSNSSPTVIEQMFLISYMWYAVIAVLLAFLAAFIASWVTNFRKGKPVDEDLSYLCCYKNKRIPQPQTPTDMDQNIDHMNVELDDVDQKELERILQKEREEEKLMEEFIDYDDDGGIYSYGVFTRNRCSRCRKSLTYRCTKL